jgi:predicted glutamine amidotransferase
MVDGKPDEQAVIIASERLTEQKSDWVRVAPNHVLMVTARLEVEVELVNVERRTLPQSGSPSQEAR